MNVAIYCRVSSQEQANEGYSIHEQERKLKSFCEVNNWKNYKVFVDAGVSGGTINRPAFNNLLANLDKFDLVLVYKLDRLTRSVRDLLSLLETFEEHGVSFRSATEVFDTTSAIGKLFITIVGAMAEWERSTIRERSLFGSHAAVREGNYIRVAPFCYDNIDGKLVPNEHKKVIEYIVKKLLEGVTATEIARRLNNANNYPPTIKNWSKTTVIRLVNNPVMRGHTKHGDLFIENTHEPIITEHDYKRISERLSSRVNYKKQTHTSVFRGVLECPQCGHKLHYFKSKLKNKSKTYYSEGYRCDYCRTDKTAHNIAITFSEIEREFIEYMSNIRLSDNYGIEVEPKNEVVKIDINKIMRKRSRFQEAYGDGLMTKEEFKQKMFETQKLIDEYEEMENEKDVDDHITKEQVQAIQNLFRHIWDSPSVSREDKEEFVRQSIKKIDFDFIPKSKVNKTPNTLKINNIDLHF
ncbi:recombinase family protein [Mammaliicoccus fleurettii]|nr:recombinase family protein [Mammaliicoccus fleurettii]QPA33639.1 recombinase family protein [Mammaliicoccus fleurettii]